MPPQTEASWASKGKGQKSSLGNVTGQFKVSGLSVQGGMVVEEFSTDQSLTLKFISWVVSSWLWSCFLPTLANSLRSSCFTSSPCPYHLLFYTLKAQGHVKIKFDCVSSRSLGNILIILTLIWYLQQLQKKVYTLQRKKKKCTLHLLGKTLITENDFFHLEYAGKLFGYPENTERVKTQ